MFRTGTIVAVTKERLRRDASGPYLCAVRPSELCGVLFTCLRRMMFREHQLALCEISMISCSLVVVRLETSGSFSMVPGGALEIKAAALWLSDVLVAFDMMVSVALSEFCRPRSWDTQAAPRGR